jgi:hypothetical protein
MGKNVLFYQRVRIDLQGIFGLPFSLFRLGAIAKGTAGQSPGMVVKPVSF